MDESYDIIPHTYHLTEVDKILHEEWTYLKNGDKLWQTYRHTLSVSGYDLKGMDYEDLTG